MDNGTKIKDVWHTKCIFQLHFLIQHSTNNAKKLLSRTCLLVFIDYTSATEFIQDKGYIYM